MDIKGKEERIKSKKLVMLTIWVVTLVVLVTGAFADVSKTIIEWDVKEGVESYIVNVANSQDEIGKQGGYYWAKVPGDKESIILPAGLTALNKKLSWAVFDSNDFGKPIDSGKIDLFESELTDEKTIEEHLEDVIEAKTTAPIRDWPLQTTDEEILQEDYEEYDIGDVNSDGRVSIIDALMIAYVSKGILPDGMPELTDEQIERGDVNLDGKITIHDARIIQLKLAGIINAIPISKIIGDVNGNNRIDIGDATFIGQYVNGLRGMDEIEKVLADVNLDGKITIEDSNIIMLQLVI